MLTVGQYIVIEQFAKQIVANVVSVIKTKNIDRKSVRYEDKKRVERNFQSTVDASGKLARSIRFELTDTYLAIYASDYVYWLVYGRKATEKGSEPGTLKDKISDWIDHKGIPIPIGMNKDTLAFLITRKIHREGSSIYLYSKGQNSGLLENIINQKLISDYNAKFTLQLEEEFKAAFNGV